MEVKQLYLSEKESWQEQLDRSILIWPFFPSHSQARQALKEAICQQEAYGIEEKGRTVLFLHGETAEDSKIYVIKNILVPELLSQQQILRFVEQFARQLIKKKVVFDFAEAAFLIEKEIFLENGYQESNGCLKKTLAYKFGLVLGGGGSHGAYQVGVWQALNEADIPIEVIVGTSVGALNGALIAQGDLEDAKSLWEEMSTDRVLSFPAAAERPEDLPSLMGQIASLTSSAIVERGVSAEPLKKLLEERISFEKMDRNPAEFFCVATRIRGMKETLVSYTPEFKEEWLAWLMASASFFPAMQPQKIGEEFYIDGGYRNNIPLDVACKQGVTDCFVVDIKGPGIIKPFRTPTTVNLISLHSPWSLGSFLLFSPERSQENLTLGYLETLKALGKLQGYWYSFEMAEDMESDWQIFYQQFNEKINEKKLPLSRNFLKKMRRYYNDRVLWEKCGQTFIELAGKYVKIEPAAIYTYTELKEKIRLVLQTGQPLKKADLSVAEWLEYYQDMIPRSDLQQFKKLYELLRKSTAEQFPAELAASYKKAPFKTLFGAFLLYIERGKL